MKYVNIRFKDIEKMKVALIEAGFTINYKGQGWHIIFHKREDVIRSRLHAIFSSDGLAIHQDVPRGKNLHRVKKHIGKQGLEAIIKLAEISKKQDNLLPKK